MKVEIIDDDNYRVFINSNYQSFLNIEDKDEIGKYIKQIILKMKKIYNILLEGFYEVHVYIVKFIGVILEIKNIDSYLSKSVDLKIIVHNDEEMFLKVLRYELIKDYSNLKYLNNYFYLDIDDILEKDIYNLIENSRIVYGNDLIEIKSKWLNLT